MQNIKIKNNQHQYNHNDKKDPSCADKVQAAFESRMDDIRKLYDDEINDTTKHVEDLGSLNEYGLSIDLVEAGTFKDQRADYIRYQLSYGGPTEEFRIYKNGDVEFWYLNWFDGAKVDVTGDDVDIIKNIVEPLELFTINE